MSQPGTYVVKRIVFNGKKVPVAMQNVNGPCPLLAVANILSLKGHFTIHEDKSAVTNDELLAAVSDYLFDANTAASDDMQKNHERNVSDVINMLPKTLVGIDVNLKFDSITSFEFTAEHMLFDFCNVRLVHGWLVDPNDANYASIRNLSYNQLVEKELSIVGVDAIAEKMENLNVNSTTTTTTTTTTTEASASTEPAASTASEEVQEKQDEKIAQAMLAERFLKETATQLTYYGLTELHSGLKDEELCVFFRNNHFNTLYKHDGELFLLVTDQGYAKTPVVWEKLCQIDGDSFFLRGDFTSYQPTSPQLAHDQFEETYREEKTMAQNEDRDLALALQLQMQEEDHHRQQQEKEEHKKQKKEKEHKEHCILQ